MSILRTAPRFDTRDAVRLARDLYGLDASAVALPSERDQNFRLDTPTGRFVLKIANGAESRAMLEAQNAAMSRVSAHGGRCPEVVRAPGGLEMVESERHLIRLLSWIPGVPFGVVKRPSDALFEDLGRRMGELDRALADFDHPAAHRAFHWDLSAAFSTIAAYLPSVADAEWRAFIAAEVGELEQRHAPERLRRSVIHNDANDYNVLVSGHEDLRGHYQQVAGILDFGDLVHSFTVADLAVTVAYAVLDKPDPLRVAARIVRGYHATYALPEAELPQLLDLVRLRLCLSACIAAYQEPDRPQDEYLSVSQVPIRRTLPRLAQIHPRFAEAVFRDACGMRAVPAADRVHAWLTGPGRARIAPDVIDGCRGATVLDLSVSSPLVAADPRANAEPALTERIRAVLRDAGADVGIGRYGEPRLLYSSALFGDPHARDERRTIHMGIDLFASPGTLVRVPLAGVVHAVADNATPFDYGPVVILRHETDAGDLFFTLYGHLTRDSLTALSPGQAVSAGQTLAAIGQPDVNGGWTPHLHFQLIVDLLDADCDYPGVCKAGDRDVWFQLSLDPNTILQLAGVEPVRIVAAAETRRRRSDHTGSNLRVSYRSPVKIVRGWMQYLYDETGRRFLDAYNNVPHVGHGHPRVVEAASNQLRVLNTNTRYLHDSLAEYAERLTATFPAPLRVCYFVNSGSEANELALRLARAHTRRRDVIVLESAYHGNTTTLIDISPYKFDGPGGRGRQPWVHVAPVPDLFRGAHRHGDPDASRKYADAVGDMTAALATQGSGIAAFIAETCPSVAGQIILPSGYLAAVYAQVRAACGVCIADEVQTAYGRMGTRFYAFDDHGVVPDVVVLGKPIGNGYPIGAVITTEEIASSFDNGMEFFSSFGGSTVSCAVGLAVLDVLKDEQRQAHAQRVGGHLVGQLRTLAERHALIGDVRGTGLFLGIELVRDRKTLEPAATEADYVVNRLREEGILIGTEGPANNVLKIRPPMPFDVEDAEFLVSVLDQVLGETR